MYSALFKIKFDVSKESEKQVGETRDFPLHNETTLNDTIAWISGKLNEQECKNAIGVDKLKE